MTKYLCDVCKVFEYDSAIGDSKTNIEAGLDPKDFPDEWRCPVCRADKTHLKEVTRSGERKKKPTVSKKTKVDDGDIEFFRDESRKILTGLCSVNKVCDGRPDRLCQGQKFGKPIGWGGAGQGKTFDANFKALAAYKLRMRISKAHKEPNIKATIFEKEIQIPVLGASLSGVKINMNDAMPEPEFQRALIEGAKSFGTIGLGGNTPLFPDNPSVNIIKENGGYGIPVFKPQNQEILKEAFKRAEDAKAIAIGVDIDGCGSTNWARVGKPVYRKSPEELKELVGFTNKPIFFKGVMSIEDAQAVAESGAQGLVVSNHGGRVMDYGQGVAEVLPEIASAFGGKLTILADGAVRTGYDVIKLLALGADATLIGRPLARMALAGGSVAVRKYLEYVQKEFRTAMVMTGCDSLDEVTERILIKKNDKI